MGTGHDDQINCAVHSSDKQDWKRHAKESNEYSSFSHLIRRAIEREVSEEFVYVGPDDAPTGTGGGIDDDTRQTIHSIDARLQTVLDELSVVRADQRTEISEEVLRRRIYHALQSHEDLVHYEVDVDGDVETESEWRWTWTADEIQERLALEGDEDDDSIEIEQIRTALDEMAADRIIKQSVRDDGERVHWRTDQVPEGER